MYQKRADRIQEENKDFLFSFPGEIHGNSIEKNPHGRGVAFVIHHDKSMKDETKQAILNKLKKVPIVWHESPGFVAEEAPVDQVFYQVPSTKQSVSEPVGV